MKQAGRGFSMIELLIGVAVLGILLALGASSFRVWINNMRIRTTTEAIQNGLQLARGEAVRRNALIRFQLVDNLNAGCVLSTTASNWVVSFEDATGNCHVIPVDDAGNNPAPRILQKRTAAEGSGNVLVAANKPALIFNGLGRATPEPPNPLVNPVVIDVQPAAAVGDCTTLRCLRVTVTVGGQIRMCDPALTLTKPNDPQSC